MQMTKMNVTPEMAKEWLSETNTANRSLSHHTVSRYATDMISGFWRDTHQNAIAFYEDGALADGQHRLSAVVKAGISVPMYVAFGLERSAANAIDQGRARKMSDVMSIMGVLSDGKYPSATVAMMNVIRTAEGATNGTPTAHQMAAAIERMKDGIDFSHKSLTTARGRIQSAPLRASLATAYYFVDRGSVADFAAVMCSGMPSGDADATVITLRNRLLLGRAMTGAKDRVDVYKMCLRFIRAYSSGKVLTMAKSGIELPFRTGAFDD